MTYGLLCCEFEKWAEEKGYELAKWTKPMPGHPYCSGETNRALDAFRAGILCGAKHDK